VYTLTGVALAVSLPTGLSVAGSATASLECGAPSLSATPGSSAIVLAGAQVFHDQTCRLTVPVRAQGGVYTVTTGTVSSAEGGTGNSATAQLIAIARVWLPLIRR
jgi:hypothetical protein